MSRIKFAFAIAALTAASGVMADVPDGYYDSLSGLNGTALRKAAKNVVRNHTRISYGNATWDAFKSTDTRFVDGKLCWWDMYSDNNVLVSTGHDGMNIEHSVAKSWWGGSSTPDSYCDLFNLNPSNANANSAKSNYPLGECSSVTWQNGVTFVGSPVAGQGGGNGKVYEPHDQYKGDFARGFMYMFTVYDDISWSSSCGWMFDTSSDQLFKKWAIELLLKWHREDPVSEKELNRNEAVYKIQHNRNPYIDSPKLAEYVWGTHKDQKYEYDGEYTPVDPDDPKTDPDDPKTDPDDPDITSSDAWYPVESAGDINETDKYILVSVNDYFGMSHNTAANNSVAYFKPTASLATTTINGHVCVKPGSEELAVFKFVRSGAGYKAHISSPEGYAKGWLACTKTKWLILADNENAEGTTFNINVSDGKSQLSFGDLGNVYYNPSSPRFTTYTSNGQKQTILYRYVKDNSTTGIEYLRPDSKTEKIFNLQGVELNQSRASLTPGIYIICRPGESPRKIQIK